MSHQLARIVNGAAIWIMSPRSEDARPNKTRKQLIKNDNQSSRDVLAMAACQSPAICNIARATSSVASPELPKSPISTQRENHGVRIRQAPIPQTHSFDELGCPVKKQAPNLGIQTNRTKQQKPESSNTSPTNHIGSALPAKRKSEMHQVASNANSSVPSVGLRLLVLLAMAFDGTLINPLY